jgi:hypothetical protein
MATIFIAAARRSPRQSLEAMLDRYKKLVKREGLEIQIKAKPLVARRAA